MRVQLWASKLQLEDMVRLLCCMTNDEKDMGCTNMMEMLRIAGSPAWYRRQQPQFLQSKTSGMGSRGTLYLKLH